MKTYAAKQVWTGKPRNFLGMAWNFTRYILTEDKLITRKGLFNIKEDEIMLYRLVDKRLERPFGQRIFGCGTVIIHAKDSDTPEKVLKSIKNPRKVMDMLDPLIETARQKQQVYGRDLMLGNVDRTLDLDGNGVPDYLEP